MLQFGNKLILSVLLININNTKLKKTLQKKFQIFLNYGLNL